MPDMAVALPKKEVPHYTFRLPWEMNMQNTLIVESLENQIAPAGVSDAVGGLPCVALAIILLVWPR